MVPLPWVALGCGALPLPTPAAGDPPLGLLADDWRDETDRDGLLEVAVEVPEPAAALQVTGDADAFVSIERLVAPDGTVVLDAADWADSREQLTTAILPFDLTASLDWPIR